MENYKLFEPCRDDQDEDEHPDCAAELWIDANDGRLNGHWLICSCDCHVDWHEDRTYAAGYAYAAGYHD